MPNRKKTTKQKSNGRRTQRPDPPIEEDAASGEGNPDQPWKILRELLEKVTLRGDKPQARFNRIFTGEEDLEGFLETFVSFGENGGMDEDDLLAYHPQVLDGQALVWWRATGKYHETWDEVRDALRETFGTQKTDYMILDDIIGMRQKPKQSVSSFLSEVTVENGKRANPLPDSTLAEIAYLRISPELRSRVVMDNGFDMSDLRTEAGKVEALLAHEARQRSRTGQAEMSFHDTPMMGRTPDHRRTWDAREGRGATGGPREQDGRIYREPLKCEDCGALGWSAVSCRKYGPCSRGPHQATGRISEVAGGGRAPWNRPKCEVTIGGRRFFALIDTGADVCVGGKPIYDLCLKDP